ncbi:GGDEF domain-containing protein [Methylomonas sp. SURF-1]|uniref:Diguanylate cyclase DosC n=1 Tax=Methylomonas aurea TaxID=2952224 RepID=A0ABT1UIM6_9GAMM|nr:GGDEF domain-containing protein [Methylomonas sp. SURF-1]MCQ8182098.1 GGDEF domain-containing protein [Methylomonas sp. SURF-1]
MLLTNHSMVEQLKLTDRKIELIKKLFDLTRADADNLLAAEPFITRNLDAIVEEFYAKQLTHLEVEIVIGDSETLSRLKNSMRGYIQEVFSGTYDQNYVTNRLRVGKVHKRIGVSPALYMSAVRLLWDILSDQFEKQYEEGHCSRDEADRRQRSLTKLLMFDVQFVFETYTGALVAEVQKAKQELEDYAHDLAETVAKQTKELRELSCQDGLTRLFNHRAFYERMRVELASCARRKEPLTLVYFDLNDFKLLNDNYGHIVGDQMLEALGSTILNSIRETDIACRYGGDEFCIIMPGATNGHAKDVCERLINGFVSRNDKHKISFSIGICQTGPDKLMSGDELVIAADKRMYLAKAQAKLEPGFWLCDTQESLGKFGMFVCGDGG